MQSVVLQVMQYIQSEAVRSAYQRLKINSFVEGNRLLKWCPGLDCGKALKVEVIVLRYYCVVTVLAVVRTGDAERDCVVCCDAVVVGLALPDKLASSALSQNGGTTLYIFYIYYKYKFHVELETSRPT